MGVVDDGDREGGSGIDHGGSRDGNNNRTVRGVLTMCPALFQALRM